MPELTWISNRYKIIRQLGSGGSSRVYLAIDKVDPAAPEVAVKLLSQLPTDNREDIEEFFRREVHALLTLNHRTIVRLLDYGHDEDNDVWYLVLEYLDGADTLFDRVPKWKPDTMACLEFVVELLEAVAYAHGANIIHRDLNPHNILMDGSGAPKIIDFGISKILGTLSGGRTVRAFFTPQYASPEQLAQRPLDFSSDVYSLAGVLYFMLTRQHPDTSVPLADQIAELDQVPPPVCAVAQKMSAAALSARYSTASQAMHALQDARHTVQRQVERYYLLLTNNAIGNLYKQAVTKLQDPVEARDVVNEDLSSEVHIVSVEGATTSDYDLIGGAMSLRCTLENNTYLVARSIIARMPPHALEGLRQRGYPVNVQWQVGVPGMPVPTNMLPLSGLLDEIDIFLQRRAVDRKTRERRKDLVETWRNLLDLERDLKAELSHQVDYVSHKVTDDNWVIRAELVGEVNVDEVFDQTQLLTMASTRGKRVAVGYYLRQEGRHMLISKLHDVQADLIAPTGKVAVDERQWAANWNRQSRALDTVVDARCVNSRLPDILIDPKQAKRDPEAFISSYFNSDLDDAKKSAVRCALGTRDVYLIQGPPGTGKTILISEIVAQILARNPKARVLLVSQSNVAIDHVLTKVGDLRPDVRIVRIGRLDAIGLGAEKFMLDRRLNGWIESVRERSMGYLNSHRASSAERRDLQQYLDLLEEIRPLVRSRAPEVPSAKTNGDLEAGLVLIREAMPGLKIEPTERSLDEAAREITLRIEAYKSTLEKTLETWHKRLGKCEEFQDAYLQSCSIVAGTCVGIVGERNLPDRFDWVIVDEAGRATPSEILISLVRGERSILVGDHKQLPPVIDHDLLERARKHPEVEPVWLEQSLFEYLFQQLPDECRIVLTNQYRMHPHIAHLISSIFYPNEQLETKVAPEDRAHGWSRWPTSVVWYSTRNRADRFEEDGAGGSKCNACEINIIEKQLSVVSLLSVDG